MNRTMSLRWRMILFVAVLPMLIMGGLMIFSGVNYQNLYREAAWTKAEILGVQVDQMASTIAPYIYSLGDAPGLETYLREAVNSIEEISFAAIVDEQGKVLVSTVVDEAGRIMPQYQDIGVNTVFTEFDENGDEFLWVSPRIIDGESHYIVERELTVNEAGEPLYVVFGEPSVYVDAPMLPIMMIIVILLVIGNVTLINFLLNRFILKPLDLLAEGVTVIGAGEVNHVIEMERDDEFGVVATAFNQMGQRLSGLISRLEQTVIDRTAALERRNRQLEAVSLVGQDVVRQRNVNELLDSTVSAIAEKFNYYHVGVFVVDDDGEWAILRAASSEGGARMLNRGHRLQVGQTGIVGNVSATGQPRVAFNVGEDATFFNNPDLPLTKSEMALPLQVDDVIVGVLDVQSVEESAFTDEDISTLQLLADQLTAALANARYTETMASTLAELRDLQVEYSERGWARVTKRLRPMSYEYDRVTTRPVPPLPVPGDLAEGTVNHKIVMDGGVPLVMESLQVGNRVLGYLGLSDTNRIWSEEELEMVRGVGEQIALALENARLFEDTQRNERQQVLISRMLQMASSPDMDAAAVLHEIARVLADGLGMAVSVLTFPQSTLRRAVIHAVIDAVGEEVLQPDIDVPVSDVHAVFFRGLEEPEIGPIAPLMDGLDALPDGPDTTELQVYNRVLYVPISAAGTQMGFIGLMVREEDPPLDPDTRELAANLANQIGVVLENLNLSEETRQRSEELRMMYRMSLTLSELLEPTEVLQAIAEQGTNLLDAEAGVLWVYTPETETLNLDYDYLNGANGNFDYRFKREEGIGGAALKEQRAMPVEDLRLWRGRDAFAAASQYGSALAVPLIGRTEPLGVLVVLSEQAGAFGEREAGLADLFAAQAAAALENARLNRDAQQRAQEFSQLYEAGIDLIQVLDAEDLLDHAADWARRVFDADRSIVFLRPPEATVFLRGQSATDDKFLTTHETDQPTVNGLTETIMRTRRSVLVPDNRELNFGSAHRLVEVGLLSQMGVPLRLGNDILGAMFVSAKTVSHFSQREMDMLEFLATQVSSALQNSLQFTQTEEALAVVRSQARYQENISSAVALLNETGTEATEEVLRMMCDAAEVPAAAYYSAETDGNERVYWKYQASWTTPDRPNLAVTNLLPSQVEVDVLPPMTAALTRDGVFQTKVLDLPDYIHARFDEAASTYSVLLGLAVQGDMAVPGMIMMLKEGEAIFWEEQELVALQTATAAFSNTLAREQLFSQVQTTLEETEVLYQGAAAISEANDYDSLLDVLMANTTIGRDSTAVTLQIFDRVWSFDEEKEPTYVDAVAVRTPFEQVTTRRRFPFSMMPGIVEALRLNSPTYIENIREPNLLGELTSKLLITQTNAYGVVVVPLVVGRQRVGYLTAMYHKERSFDENEQRRISTLTQQAAIAMLNIVQLRATEARVRREQMIREITANIQQAPDVDGVLQTALQELGRAFGTSRNQIQFRTPQSASSAPAQRSTDILDERKLQE